MTDYSDDEYEYEYHDSEASVTSSTSDPGDSSGDDSDIAPELFDSSEAPYKILTTISMWQLQHVKNLQKDVVAEAALALNVSPEAAMPLLKQSSWNMQALLQRFYEDPHKALQEAKVRDRCRHLWASEMKNGVKNNNNDNMCLICMEDIDDDSLSMGCGHDFCTDCWGNYLMNVIQGEGATCTDATCPQAECEEAITEAEVQAAAPHLLAKFQYYQLQAFVESNPQLRWCPGKGCDRIAYCRGTKSSKRQQSKPITAACDACNSTFCFGCGEEAHAPATCQQLTLWKEKNTSGDSETANWMTVNTKPCPKCGKRIEKDGGCMYMTCSKCHHGFCWMCMGTHHVWSCNAYTEKEKNGAAVDEKIRAKNALERYLHYYQRYDGHEKAEVFAQKQLEKCRAQELTDNDMPAEEEDKADVVQGLVNVPLLIEANQQIVRCRQVLKASYVFAFYHFSPDNNKENEDSFMSIMDKIQKECFEQHQGILEGMTEELSKVTEMPRDKMDRQDVVNRSRAIGQFIKNVLEYVGEGM
jgi:ariadne-1